MSRDDLIKRVQALSDEEFARIAPFIETVLDATPGNGGLDEEGLVLEIEAGLESALTEPLMTTELVFARARLARTRSAP